MDHATYSQEIRINGGKRQRRTGRAPQAEISVTITERAAPHRTATRVCTCGADVEQAQAECIANILSR